MAVKFAADSSELSNEGAPVEGAAVDSVEAKRLEAGLSLLQDKPCLQLITALNQLHGWSVQQRLARVCIRQRDGSVVYMDRLAMVND